MGKCCWYWTASCHWTQRMRDQNITFHYNNVPNSGMHAFKTTPFAMDVFFLVLKRVQNISCYRGITFFSGWVIFHPFLLESNITPPIIGKGVYWIRSNVLRSYLFGRDSHDVWTTCDLVSYLSPLFLLRDQIKIRFGRTKTWVFYMIKIQYLKQTTLSRQILKWSNILWDF